MSFWSWLPPAPIVPIPALSSGVGIAMQGPTVVAAAGGTVTLPGPASGYVRIFDEIFFTAANPAAPLALGSIVVRILPSVTLTLIGPILSGGTIATNSFRVPPALVAGESLQFTNNNAVNLVVVGATYEDIPDPGNLFLVRQSLGAAFTTIMPVPPAGFRHRWYQAGSQIFTADRTLASRCVMCNLDTITHVLIVRQGGNILSRVLAPGTAGPGGTTAAAAPVQQWSIGSTDAALEGATAAAVATTSPLFMGVYQRVPE